MDSFAVEGHGLLVDGAVNNTPTKARASALEWLLAKGVDEFDAEVAVETAPVSRAWWGGDELGFVQKEHEGAQLVVVVRLPDEMLSD